MSDKERFSLYKHYECLMSRLMRYSSGCKYEKDSLEDMYAKMINDDINSFAYVEDKNVMDMTFNYLIKSMKNKYVSYKTEVFKNNGIDFLYDFNYECSFDAFVGQVKDALFVYEKKCGAIEDILSKIEEITKDNQISVFVAEYIDKIVLQANNFNSLLEYHENQKRIDAMLSTLKEMINKFNSYNNKAIIINELIGDYAPKGLKDFLETFKKAIWEGRFASADSTLLALNTSLTRFKVIRSEATFALKVIEENYNTRLKRIKNPESIEIANKIYSIVIDILHNVLKGNEEREILGKLQQITFRSMEEIYELVSYKTKSLYIDIDSNKKVVGDKLLVKIDADDKYFYCFYYPGLEMLKLAKRDFNKKYASVYGLYSKRNKFDADFIDTLDFWSVPVVQKVDNLSVTGTINRIVEFIDEKRMDVDKNNDMALKREK